MSSNKSNQTIKQVESIIKETLRKNQRDIEMALIRPPSPEYPFSTNGVYFLIGKMGAGKSFFIWRHIMITERLFKQPYYSKIIFCSSSGKLDKTAEVLSKNVKTPICYVKEDNLLLYLQRHLKRKLKYYALVKHVMSRMKDTNNEMRRLIQKHSLYEIEDRIDYIAQKMMKYDTSAYPYNTLLILDDAAGSPLLKNGNSPLCRLLTKTRHFNLTAIIAVQTLRFVHLNVKRLATDIICYAGYSKEDFTSMLQQTPNNLDLKSTVEEYLNHKGQHDRFIINITAGEAHFETE